MDRGNRGYQFLSHFNSISSSLMFFPFSGADGKKNISEDDIQMCLNMVEDDLGYQILSQEEDKTSLVMILNCG